MEIDRRDVERSRAIHDAWFDVRFQCSRTGEEGGVCCGLADRSFWEEGRFMLRCVR